MMAHVNLVVEAMGMDPLHFPHGRWLAELMTLNANDPQRVE